MKNENNVSGLSRKPTVTHSGGCHCGAVRFEVDLPAGFQGSRCNCSICQKLGSTGHVVQPQAFRLLAGEGSLGRYEWGMRSAARRFCQHCGVYCFGAGHIPQLGGDFVSPNLNCLDDFDVNALELVHWDGRHDNWMAGPAKTPWPVVTDADRAAASA